MADNTYTYKKTVGRISVYLYLEMNVLEYCNPIASKQTMEFMAIGETDLWKKPEAENLVSDRLPLMMRDLPQGVSTVHLRRSMESRKIYERHIREDGIEHVTRVVCH